ncbi:hypothetical protein Syun_015106 [Stephania yunnanensis]|uniref:Protein kinase domain-containing protein n=1 Tax=Stephania yunnanensis TaxID=152371 RepID=A0AAP0PCI4_9MAGN
MVVAPGDNVLAVHVQDKSRENFDPNTFYIHEDLCKSKQVDFQIKVHDEGGPFTAALAHDVRVHFARMIVIGSRNSRPNDKFIVSFLRELPPTCSLLVMDSGGRILVRKPGTSQQGCPNQELRPSFLSSSSSSSIGQSSKVYRHTEPLHLASSSKLPPRRCISNGIEDRGKNPMQALDTMAQKQFQRLAAIELNGTSKRYTQQELKCATDKFNPRNLIGESDHSKVFKAELNDGKAAAVKVLNITTRSGEELFQEVEILSGLEHYHIVKLIGYCYSKNLHAVVYNLLEGSLKQKLRSLAWSDRMKVAIGVAKALERLHHHCSPPIVHRDVKSSNVLLTRHNEAQLADFGTAMLIHEAQQPSASAKPYHVVGTFGYLAPEYMMYGKVDEKTDVYSYGVVLLEVITGKDAIQKNVEPKHESLVLWARSLLSSGLWERLIDPNLGKDVDEEEMQRMMIATRLCLMHSSSRRPTMSKIRKLLEEPEYCVKMQREREELMNGLSHKEESSIHKQSLSHQWHFNDLSILNIK